MDIILAKTIISSISCLTIGIACYVTKSALPLWALFFVGLMMESPM